MSGIAMNWFHLAVGVLVLLSPWLLGMGDSAIAWVNALFGVTLILANLWIIFVRDAK